MLATLESLLVSAVAIRISWQISTNGPQMGNQPLGTNRVFTRVNLPGISPAGDVTEAYFDNKHKGIKQTYKLVTSQGASSVPHSR